MYSNAGGGGERVLWAAVKALQTAHGADLVIMIYTGDIAASGPELATEEMVAKVQVRRSLRSRAHELSVHKD